MISSEYEWQARIRNILRNRLGTGKEESLPVAEDIITLIRDDRWARTQLQQLREAREEEVQTKPAWQAVERRLTRLSFRVALVQLLALLLAVLLLAG